MKQKPLATDVTMFAGLSPELLAYLDRVLIWRRFRAGEEIIDRQSDSRDVFFVVEGMVRVVLYSVSGREITLDDIGPGGYFGELAALDGEPRSASVMAVEPSLVASLGDEPFRKVSTEHPAVALALMRRLAAVVRTSSGRILDLSTLGANNRVHAEVLRLARAAGEDENGRAVISPIPVHSDMASRVSTTRETVARVMSDLSRQGIVKREKSALVVQDVARLAAIVEDVRGDL
ncbi:Crp/Fnr family transcriptional regulator [Oleispirillum naphthae]|uniref:Crp/Fnr family transcriptional regulator n=1 Tax=Oleispirillum naphthae TaxID=2838853 RepID=UPI00308230C9